MQSFDVPILVLIFNREKKSRILLDRIRQIKPKELFISADGPREGKLGEKEICERTRAVFNDIDWDCKVHSLFRKENLGCKKAVHGGISWFFEHVPQGIILEDDCIPDPSFFPFCRELLSKYEDNHQITHITAHNPLGASDMDESYFFSKQVLVWGWATWKRAWENIDINLEKLQPFLNQNLMDAYILDKNAQKYIVEKWEAAASGKLDSWAYPWGFSSFEQKGLAIIPKNNLIHNIGFDEEATNTFKAKPNSIKSPVHFPLKHPEKIMTDESVELDIFHHSQKNKWNLLLWNFPLYKWYRNIRAEE